MAGGKTSGPGSLFNLLLRVPRSGSLDAEDPEGYGKEDRAGLLREIRNIEITTGILVKGLQSGLHLSVFRGQGVEFTDIREYVPGDDIRSIDWKVTARSERPFVKEFREDRDQTFYIALDISGSGLFGSRVTRQRVMIQVLASLGFAALRNNDRVGLFLFSDRVEKFIPARRGRKHLISLLNAAISHTPESRGTDISGALHFLGLALQRQSSIIILSDFIAPPFEKEIQLLAGRHEVIAARVTDPRELDLPDIGFIELEDPETGEQVLADTSDAAFRERYRDIAEIEEKHFSAVLAAARVPGIRIFTTESYEIPIRRFFLGLKKKRNSHGRVY